MKCKKYYPDGSYDYFDYELYHSLNNSQRKKEYPITQFQHQIYQHIINAYNTSPWLNIKKFIYKNKLYYVKDITVVYDSGYVLRLNYTYKNKQGKIVQLYRYIHNINSIKYLKLLKFKDIQVV